MYIVYAHGLGNAGKDRVGETQCPCFPHYSNCFGCPWTRRSKHSAGDFVKDFSIVFVRQKKKSLLQTLYRMAKDAFRPYRSGLLPQMTWWQRRPWWLLCVCSFLHKGPVTSESSTEETRQISLWALGPLYAFLRRLLSSSHFSCRILTSIFSPRRHDLSPCACVQGSQLPSLNFLAAHLFCVWFK